MKGFKALDDKVFFSKNDKLDPRLGDKALNEINLSQGVFLAGYPDDEGVLNNGGRVGAALGPSRIRHFLYKMTPHLYLPNQFNLIDVGDLIIEGLPIEKRHALAKEAVKDVLIKGSRWLSFGGGHDYGFSDGAAFAEYCFNNNQKPLIINFDAHLDVRPVVKKINSGTAFYRLLSEYPQIELLQVGIQSHCNSKEHLNWALDKGSQVLSCDEINHSNSTNNKILEFLEPYLLKRRPCFISLDIDVFSASHAPGCSQSWPLGLNPTEVFKVFSVLFERLDVRVFGIYEVAPSLDNQDITSKLAAQFAFQYLTSI